MLVLGIETSTPQASVAIGSEQGVVASALNSRGAGHAEFILPAIHFCLEQTGLVYRNLGGVAVSLGPGLFTGMRTGVATAKALAHALSLPIVGMSSLDLVAYEVRYSPKTICAVLDARRDEVFYAFYRPSPGGIQRMTEYEVGKPERLAILIASQAEEVLLVGNGALFYKDLLAEVGPGVEIAAMSHAFPNASSLVDLAVPRVLREDFDSLYDLKPLYLRRSARPIRWERIREMRRP